MEETPHLVAHFMAVGAEKRLEDYHFLRNTYETISGQETQLNRILRMLGEDEISLHWRRDLLPIGRGRSRSLYEFDRLKNTIVLQGSIAYERLRELEQDNLKHERQPIVPSPPRRVQELRERRQRLSEQRELSPASTSGRNKASSSSRSQDLCEYDSALAEFEEKRQRRAEENRLKTSRTEEKEIADTRRERFEPTFDDGNRTKASKNEDQDVTGRRRERAPDRENRSYTSSVDDDKASDRRSERFKPISEHGNRSDVSKNEERESSKGRSGTFTKTSEDEDRFKTSKNGENDATERRRSSFKSAFENEEQSSASKDNGNESTERRRSSFKPTSEDEKQPDASKSKGNESTERRRSSFKSAPEAEEQSHTSREKDNQSTERRRSSFKQTPEGEEQSSASKDNGIEPTERRRSSFKQTLEGEEQSSASKNKDDEPTERRRSSFKQTPEGEEQSSASKDNGIEPTERRRSSFKSAPEAEEQSQTSEEKDNQSTERRRSSFKQTPEGEEQSSASKDNGNESSERRRSSFKPTSEDKEQSSASKNRDDEPTERRRSSFKPTSEDENQVDAPKTAKKEVKERRRERFEPTINNDDTRSNVLENLKEESTEGNRNKVTTASNDDNQEDEKLNEREKNSNKIRKSSADDDLNQSGDVEFTSFTVLCESAPSSDKKHEENYYSVRLLCQWTLPGSSSAINYYTIEQQSDDKQWSPIGGKISTSENQTQLDISSLNEDEFNGNTPLYFRLKAHLRNGHISTSKPTDGVYISLPKEKHVIIPDVEVLSSTSVQLTWADDENEENGNENDAEDKTDMYDIEKKEDEEDDEESHWEKVTEVPFSQRSARIDSLTDAKQCQFRLVQSSAEPEELPEAENQAKPDLLTLDSLKDWLNALHIESTSPNTVNIDVADDGFTKFNSYQIEYTTNEELDQWEQVSNITRDEPHLKIEDLEEGTDYKIRFTPIFPGTSTTTDGPDASSLTVTLSVKTPSPRKGRFSEDRSKTAVVSPPQFTIQTLDPTTVLIEAVVPAVEEPAAFEDVFDVFSKNETADDDWTKVGTIDKEHLSTTVENLEENTAYAFKIDNVTTPSADDSEINTVQEFQFDTTPVKQYDAGLLLEKIEESLENVVNSVMRAAAGHQTLEEPVNKSLNEVIREVFRDETLVPSEKYGFDTLALNNDLQLYRGPKQMMLKELEIDETTHLSEHYGEIIIHNYPTSQQSVLVREENGNTRVTNIDGDIIIRNVVSDVQLKNEQTHHQLSMNIVGQAFVKGVQGTLIASKFRGIIVVKNVHKP